ncbi:DUF2510 domain-containing protein [Nocardioides bruguierae]|uniref:DUF2510 domain-containing protein n=1 Tax=Nocardioides bruguierae TaxID=2945102 RepID=A0A9X2DA65_9ACTN|nr:DUF2510 domain-containing protein [Nocardioides bruguierae]MCM0622183.1 DUF2510 domain-containing protein [Nocardioides bruguierae]
MSDNEANAPAGWYPQGDGIRWWDGTAWQGPVHPRQAASAQPNPEAALQMAAARIVQRGGRIESQSPNLIVVVTGRPISHVLHLLLSLLTCGLWLPVWLALAVIYGERRTMLSIGRDGRVVKAGTVRVR